MTEIIFSEISDLDKSKKYMIVGVRKSGTQSFLKYLISKGFDVTMFEGRFHLEEFSSKHNYQRIPIIIIRHLIDRAWSDFEYFKDFDPPMNPRGMDDAIEPSKYQEHLKKWTNPILFTFDYVTHLEGFPKVNKNINKRKMTKADRDNLKLKLNYGGT